MKFKNKKPLHHFICITMDKKFQVDTELNLKYYKTVRHYRTTVFYNWIK